MTDHDHAGQMARFGICGYCTAAAVEAEVKARAAEAEIVNPEPDGDTYSRDADYERLTGQSKRVYDLMADGQWRTLAEISSFLHDPEASISARLRDLRKPKFGEHTVNRRHRGPKEDGLYEYQLVPAGRML